MAILSVLALAFVASCASAAKQFVATFGGGVTGSVMVDDGKVSVMLDLSGVDESMLPSDLATCSQNGLTWHIHEKWEFNSTDGLVGPTLCGPLYTGGHEDPWNGCGPASGNDYCETSSNTNPFACIPVGSYSPDFPAMPFSVEVGDWSGKYGKIMLNAEKKFPLKSWSNHYEVLPSDLVGLSVVFHCNDGKRAFCAPFMPSSEPLAATVPAQDNMVDVTAKFDVLSADSMVKLSWTGEVQIVLDATSTFDASSAPCTTYQYSIFNAKADMPLTGSKKGDECNAYVAAQFDPTHQCYGGWSDSPYCTGTTLCNDTSYDYSCTNVIADRYDCAPADLSGKFGKFKPTEKLEVSTSAPHVTLLPPTNKLGGKVMGIHCAYKDQPTLKFLACASLDAQGTPSPTMAPTPGDSKAGVLSATAPLILALASLLAVLAF